jgi:carbamoyl-phosphate synthase large subunit
MLRGRRIFVTGGAGVIGRELVPRLLKHGAKVFVGDRKQRPAGWQGNVLYRVGDLNELQFDELDDFSPEIVIHLAAAFERSVESTEFWEENFRHNLQLSHSLMSMVRQVESVKRVVFASSYLVYDPTLYLSSDKGGQQEARQLSESDILNPRNLIGAAKLLHEGELAYLQRTAVRPLSIAVARIFRGYGRGSRDVISRWVRAALQNKELELYCPEGLFDYVYAADSAEGLARLAASSFSGTVNLGTGRARRVEDVIGCLRENFPGLKVKYLDSSERIESSSANTELLMSVLGWIPSITLEEAIPEIISYESSIVADEEPRFCVLVSSAATEIPLLDAVQKAAGRYSPNVHVIAGDSNGDCLAKYAGFNFWQMPRTEDENLEELLDGMNQRGIRLVLPTRDGELEFFSRHLQKFKDRGIDVSVSGTEAVVTCLDKLQFFQRLNGLIPVIPTHEFFDEKMLGDGTYVVKERFGAGSLSIGLNLGASDTQIHAKKLKSPVFQPFIEGQEFSVDAFTTNLGHLQGVVVRSRDRVVSGESQVTTLVHDSEIGDLASTLFQSLGLRGHAVAQIIRSADGLHVIECNPRIGGASTLSFQSGLHSLCWAILEADGEDLSMYPFKSTKHTLRLVRVAKDVFFDLGS